MKRRDFFKFLGKGAAAAGVAATVGVPEVDNKNISESLSSLSKPTKKATEAMNELGVSASHFGYSIVSQPLSDEEIKEAYRNSKKFLPELVPLWEPTTTFNGLSDYVTTGHDADA